MAAATPPIGVHWMQTSCQLFDCLARSGHARPGPHRPASQRLSRPSRGASVSRCVRFCGRFLKGTRFHLVARCRLSAECVRPKKIPKMKFPYVLPAIAMALCLTSWRGLDAEEFTSDELGFVVTIDEEWSKADAATTKRLTDMVSQGAVAHARRKDPAASASAVDSEILLLCSKLPLGAQGDNPNFILAKEKAWSEG